MSNPTVEGAIPLTDQSNSVTEFLGRLQADNPMDALTDQARGNAHARFQKHGVEVLDQDVVLTELSLAAKDGFVVLEYRAAAIREADLL